MATMTTELEMLIYVSVFTLLLWLPYILARIASHGLADSLTYKSDSVPYSGWTDRAKKAHYNAIENLAPFAAIVLVAHIQGISNEVTQTCALAYLVCRIAHPILYILNIPLTRTLSFFGGWLATLGIAWQVLAA